MHFASAWHRVATNDDHKDNIRAKSRYRTTHYRQLQRMRIHMTMLHTARQVTARQEIARIRATAMAILAATPHSLSRLWFSRSAAAMAGGFCIKRNAVYVISTCKSQFSSRSAHFGQDSATAQARKARQGGAADFFSLTQIEAMSFFGFHALTLCVSEMTPHLSRRILGRDALVTLSRRSLACRPTGSEIISYSAHSTLAQTYCAFARHTASFKSPIRTQSKTPHMQHHIQQPRHAYSRSRHRQCMTCLSRLEVEAVVLPYHQV